MEFAPVQLNEEYLMTRIGRLTVNLGAAVEQINARDARIEELTRLVSEHDAQINKLNETIAALLEDADDDED